MAVTSIPRLFLTLLFLVSSQAWYTSAQTTSYSPYPTSADSGGGTYAGDTTFLNSGPTDAAGENAAGASGSQGGSVNLSMGAIIAIVVVVAVVVLLGGMFAFGGL